MRKDLGFLPEHKQRELMRIVSILFEELEDKQKTATTPRRKNGRILKVILFGSHARGDFVDDPKGGYFSDFDLLVIVNSPDLTDETAYWSGAQDRIIHDRALTTPVGLIFHTMAEVNDAICEGQYFFTDIRREGVLVYELIEQSPSGKGKHFLAEPGQPDPARTLEMATGYFEDWKTRAESFLKYGRLAVDDNDLKIAAFLFHQAAEGAYTKYMLVRTLYRPKDHNLKRLRAMAEDRDERLREAWPRGRKPYDRYFDLLNRAYVEARYSPHYETTREILTWQADHAARLLRLTDTACEDWLDSL